jgi:hypothetical protein
MTETNDEHGHLALNKSAWHIICALKRKVVSRARSESKAAQKSKEKDLKLCREHEVKYELLLWVLQTIVEMKKKHQWEDNLHERNKLMGRAGPQSETEIPPDELERRKQAIRANWSDEEHEKRFSGGRRGPYEIPEVG